MRSKHYFLILLTVLILTLDLMLEKLLQWDLVGTHWEFVGTQWEYGRNVVGADRELLRRMYGVDTRFYT